MSGDIPPPLSGLGVAALGDLVYILGGCMNVDGSIGASKVLQRV